MGFLPIRCCNKEWNKELEESEICEIANMFEECPLETNIEKFAQENQKIFKCTTKDCGNYLDVEECTSKTFWCTNCGWEYCLYCRSKAHPDLMWDEMKEYFGACDDLESSYEEEKVTKVSIEI